MGGVPCLGGLRIPVATILAMIAEGQTPQEILALYPDLELEDIREALLLLPRPFENAPCLSPLRMRFLVDNALSSVLATLLTEEPSIYQ